MPWRGLAGDIQYPSSARQGLATLPPSPRLWRTGCPKPRRRVRLTFTLAARYAKRAERLPPIAMVHACQALRMAVPPAGQKLVAGESQRRITAFYRPEKRWATHRALCVRSPFGQWPRSPKRRALSRRPRSLGSHVALSPAPLSGAPLKTSDGRPFPGEVSSPPGCAESARNHSAPRTAHRSAGPAAARSAPTPPERNTGMKPCPCCAGQRAPTPSGAERCGRGNTSGLKSRIVLTARTPVFGYRRGRETCTVRPMWRHRPAPPTAVPCEYPGKNTKPGTGLSRLKE